MRLLRVFGVLCAATMLAAPSLALSFGVAMDQQINAGLPGTAQSPNGNAIYIPNFGPAGAPSGTLSFGSDGTDGWTRATMPGDKNTDPAIKQGWYYLYLDTALAGIGPVDLSQAGSTISFDTRFFQDPNTNTNPYADAPVFLRLYTYGGPNYDSLVGYRDYSIVYATQRGDKPYPDWTNVTVDINSAPFTGGGTFDPSKVTRIRWYGTDWFGSGKDFLDVKDVVFSGQNVIPEPGTMSLLALGALPMLRGLRRRKN